MQLFRLPAAAGAGIGGLWPSPAGNRLAVVLTDSDGPFRLWFWDLSADRPDWALDLDDAAGRGIDRPLPAFSPGWRLMTTDTDLRRVAEPDWRVPLWPTGPGAGHPLAFAFSPDGASVYGSSTGFVYRWDVPADRSATVAPPVARLPGGSGDSVAVSPAGDELAVTAGANVFRWRRPDHVPLPRVRVPPRLGPAGRLAYGPDGRTLAVAAPNGVLLCDLTGNGPRRPLAGYVRSLAFTPDGRLLTTTPDGGVTVWDVNTGTPRERYTFADLGYVWEVAIAPDGLTAYAAGAGGRLVRWDL